MCSDENGAPHAVRYLNAQLTVLHENAKKCLEEHGHARTEENKHFYALAEFTMQKPGTSDVVFGATFDAAELEFICDHDALLHLTLTEGFAVIDSTRPGQDGQEIQLPSPLRMSYRVSFETRRIVGNDLKVGDHASTIQLIIFDLKKSTLVSTSPDVTSGRDLVVRYLAEYLSVLQNCGNHVLFSLPQFDPHGTTMTIDFSLMETEQSMMRDIYNITVQQINTYMSSVWLKSAMLAHSGNMQMVGVDGDWRALSLAEFSTTASGIEEFGQFRLKMGPPNVEILCAKEVIVYFNIEEVEFIDDENGESVCRFEEWKIAIVVDVVYSSEEAGRVVNLTLDLSRARYHDIKSKYPGLEDDDAQANEFHVELVQFFSEEYLHILESAGYHTIYSRDVRWETSSAFSTTHEDADGSWWSLEQSDVAGASSRETIQRTKMHGFDQVTAISQGSLNAQFAALCATAQSMFRQWTYDDFFRATFRPISLRLLSANRAIVWVHMQGGSLKTLRDWKPHKDGIQHEFGDWRLAFEVELKMCSHNDLEGFDAASYLGSAAYQKHGNATDRDLWHIYLDLRRAEYLHDYSTFSDLAGSKEDNRNSVLKLQAVVYYITQHYFPAICQNAQHVVSSVPVWKAGKSLPSYALTSVAFHVYSKVDITRYNWSHVVPGMEPIIVVFGMTGFRPLISNHLDFSTGWVVQGNKGFSHGTISISKRVFIEERLLTLLSRVNALTTMIPLNPDAFQALRGLRLVPWSLHEQRKDRPSRWELQPSDAEGSLKYLWEHCEEWQYTLRGNSNIMSGTHGVSCITRNYVELPIAVREGALRIKVSGKVDFNMSLRNTKLYTASASVGWSTHVAVQTIGSGIRVSTAGSHDPVFAKAEFSEGAAAMFNNPAEMLANAFPTKVDLDELVQEINAFEGAWQYYYPLLNAYSLASPVFNDDGDLLFELRRYGHGSAAATRKLNSTVSPSSSSGRSSPIPRRIGRSRTPVPSDRSRSPADFRSATSPRSQSHRPANLQIPGSPRSSSSHSSSVTLGRSELGIGLRG